MSPPEIDRAWLREANRRANWRFLREIALYCLFGGWMWLCGYWSN